MHAHGVEQEWVQLATASVACDMSVRPVCVVCIFTNMRASFCPRVADVMGKVEMIMKLVGLGWDYFSDGFNIFDMVVNLLSGATIVVQLVTSEGAHAPSAWPTMPFIPLMLITDSKF